MKLAEINELRADPLSAMPAGLIDGLSEADVIDLVAFLVTDPRDASRALPTLAQASGPSTSSSVAPANAAPPLRSRREVGATLSKSAQGPRTQNLVPLNITLVSSRPERGSNDHAYPAWQTNWVRLLSQADAVWVSAALDWPSVEQFKQADALLFYSSNLEWSSNHLQQIDRFLERGGGLVFLHASCLAAQNPEAVAARLGLAAGTARVQFRSGPVTLNVDSSSGHPVTFGFGSLQLVDEVFGPLTGDSAKIEILATSELEGQKRPMLWTYEKGPGRVFVSVLGHQAWTFDDPLFRALILRGLSWSAGAASTRFENLATRGVTLRDP